MLTAKYTVLPPILIHRIYPAIRIFLLSAMFLLLSAGAWTAYKQQSYQGHYVYVFYECTGSNQFICVDGKECAIHLKSGDDAAYYDLLQSSPWRVLYPSENQGKIILVGTYTPWTKEFRLERWYWQGNVVVLGGPEFWDEPGLGSVIVRPNLLPLDFCADEYRPCESKPDLQKLGIVASSKAYREKRGRRN